MAPPSTPPDASAEGHEVAERLQARLGLDEHQRDCFAAWLDAEPALRDRLNGDPVEADLSAATRGVAMCVSRTAGATQFAINVAQQVGDASSERLACLRDAYASITDEELKALDRAISLPGTTVPAADAAIRSLLVRCGIDPSALPPA